MGKDGTGKFMTKIGKIKYIINNGKGNTIVFNFYGIHLRKYEGEYSDGEKNGKGKEYDYNDKLIYEGEFLNGYRNGNGKEYINNKLVYEGKYLNGERNEMDIEMETVKNILIIN